MFVLVCSDDGAGDGTDDSRWWTDGTNDVAAYGAADATWHRSMQR